MFDVNIVSKICAIANSFENDDGECKIVILPNKGIIVDACCNNDDIWLLECLLENLICLCFENQLVMQMQPKDECKSVIYIH